VKLRYNEYSYQSSVRGVSKAKRWCFLFGPFRGYHRNSPGCCLGKVFTELLPRECVYRVVSSGTCLRSDCPRERVYGAVAPGTYLPSGCPGNVFTERLPREVLYRTVASGTYLPSGCLGNMLTGLAVPWQRPVNNYEVVFSFGSVLRLYKGGCGSEGDSWSEGSWL
jgi:hypothetical protein